MRLIAAIGVVTIQAAAASAQAIDTRSAVCLPPEQQRIIEQRIHANRIVFGLPPSPADGPLLYPFVPLGGTPYRDITTGNFVDLDGGAAVLNYLCAHYGNDGHAGCDYGAPTWQDMAIGIPIFAALDGVVVDVHDGDPDMNTSCQAGGNYVIVDHGGGRTAWYLHMKKDSVAVAISQVVKAGQQLGLVGSSGCSFGPHLHFQSMNGGTVYEPYAGACRPGQSGWVQQVDPPSGVFVRNVGVTTQDLAAWPGLPTRPPTTPQFSFGDGNVFYWIELCNLPPNSTWTEHYVRPDGSLEYELGPFGFGNATTYGYSLYWFNRFVGGMHSIAGTWHFKFDVNGAQVVDIPVDVVSTPTAGFNRPPLPVSAVFDPPIPTASDVVFARLTAPLGIRDLDWDLVRYRYLWKVNGVTVRDVVSAGMADCVPRATAVPGDILECTITPGDGQLSGSPLTLRLAFGCYANCDASTATPRLNALDFGCFLNRYAAGDPSANCDRSTAPPTLNALDFACFLTSYAAGCS